VSGKAAVLLSSISALLVAPTVRLFSGPHTQNTIPRGLILGTGNLQLSDNIRRLKLWAVLLPINDTPAQTNICLQTPQPGERRRYKPMRSDLIFGALTHVQNRYQLCQLASKATRKLHKPNTRLQDTTNEVLERFHEQAPSDLKTGPEPAAILETIEERRAA
jgi:hypothetical protein